MALPVNGSTHLIPAYYSFIDQRKDERLSWLTCSGWFTHISGHPSAAARAQDRESSPVRDRRSTTVLRHQLTKRWHLLCTSCQPAQSHATCAALTEVIIILATSDDGRTSRSRDSPSHTPSSCHIIHRLPTIKAAVNCVIAHEECRRGIY